MSDPNSSGVRPVTLLAAIALVVANMIGVGIFTTTGFQAGGVGGAQPALLGWVIGGVLALCGAAVYGELGAMMPRAGGEYVYLREAFAPVLGFLSGWVSLIVGFSAPIAAAAYAFGRYLNLVWDAVPVKVAGVGLIAGVTILHSISVVLGARVQTFFSLLKVGLILFLIIAGLSVGHGDWSNVSAGAGLERIHSEGFAVSLVFIMFSYSGWNAAAYVAGEVKNPGRNVPLALLVGTGIVMVLYIMLNLVFFYAAPAAELATAGGTPDKPFPVVEVGGYTAVAMFGSTAGKLLSTLIAIALISSVSAMVMAGPRVYMAMAEDGLFFRALARRNTGGAPVGSVLLQGGLAVGLLLVAKFGWLVKYIGFTLSIFATLAIIGCFVLRRTCPDAPRPYRAIGWPVTPILFVAINLWMIYFLLKKEPMSSLVGLGTLAVGVAVFFVWRGSGAGGSTARD